jgi:PIN domain nuclease of toxin-antitoxin system
MSLGLNRYHQTGHLHFITFSCTRKRNILGTPEARTKFVEILEQSRYADPFDRLLIAQALTESLPILTGDRIFARYGIKLVW